MSYYLIDDAKLKEKEKKRNVILFTSTRNNNWSWKALSLDQDVSVEGCKLPKGIPQAIKTDNVFVHTDTRGEIALLSDSKSAVFSLDKSSGSWTQGKAWKDKVAHKTFVELAPYRSWIFAGLKVGGNYPNTGVYTKGAFHRGWKYQIPNSLWSVLHPCAVDIGDGKVLTFGGYATRNSAPSKAKFWQMRATTVDIKNGV